MRVFSMSALFCVFIFLLGCEEEDSGFSFSRDASTVNPNGTAAKLEEFNPRVFDDYRLVAGNGRTCGFASANAFNTSSFLNCWGRSIPANQRGQVNTNVAGQNHVLSIGADHVCTIETTNARTVRCDGSNQYGENTDPEPAITSGYQGHWVDKPYLVASGDHHNCALDQYGIYCWGKNEQGQADVPSLAAPKWVSAGGDTSCAIDANDFVQCWGDNGQGQTDVPSNLGAVNQVDVGADFACAITAQGEVACWGATENWDQEPKISYSDPVHISVGAYHACVIDDLGGDQFEVDCFGQENEPGNLLAVPVIFSDVAGFNPKTIDAGVGHSCMIAEYEGYLEGESGEPEAQTVRGIACWGRNESNQSRPPLKACFGYYDQNSEEARRCINF